jgi:hypothetical protein
MIFSLADPTIMLFSIYAKELKACVNKNLKKDVYSGFLKNKFYYVYLIQINIGYQGYWRRKIGRNVS